MSSSKRIKRIEEFFDNLTIEELEKRLELAGIYEIKPSSNAGMELLLNSKDASDQNMDLLYVNKKDTFQQRINSYDVYTNNYTKAV